MPEAQSSDEGTPEEEADSTASSGGDSSTSDTGSAHNYKPTDYQRAQDQLRRLEALEEGASDLEKIRIRGLVLGVHNKINALLRRDKVDYGHGVVEPDTKGATPIPIFKQEPGVRQFEMQGRSLGEFQRGVHELTETLGSGYYDKIATVLKTELDTEEKLRQVHESRSESGRSDSEGAGEVSEAAEVITPIVVSDEPPDADDEPPDDEDTPEGPAREGEDSEDGGEEAEGGETEGGEEEEGWGAAWDKTKWSQITKYWGKRFSKHNEGGPDETGRTRARKILLGWKNGEGFKKWSWRSLMTGKDIVTLEWIKWTEGTFLDRINLFSDKFILKFW